MKQLIFIISIWATASLLSGLQAQILTVSEGTDMTIKPGTIFSADSLILTPSADFTLSNLSLNKNASVINPLPKPYIARVYQFTNTTNPFSGAVQINYRDEELNGINESGLALNIYNGTAWNAYTATSRDAADNFVLTSGLNAVAFNELTLADTCPPPVIQCNADMTVNATAGECGATVSYSAPIVTDACENTSVAQIEGLASGSLFPVGITTNRFVATSSSGQKDTCSFTVTVLDKEAPVITQVSASPSSLWPPNHQMKDVTINYTASDNCGGVTSKLSVSSNEPVNGTGDGDTSPDWIIVNDHHVQLRAERSGRGNGRVYTITIISRDASGNTSTQTTQVVVPHNSNGKMDYVDQLFECKVIPNPSSQYFELQVNSGSNEKIEVNLYDIRGRFLSKMNAVNYQTLRFGSNLRPGTYMVEVTQGLQRQRIYVVKQ
jgi:hypothetical protein